MSDSPHRSLSGKSIVVTGASRGLGRAMACALAAAGARVAVTGRDTAALDATLAMMPAGAAAARFVLDMTNSAAVDAFAKALWSEWGAIDTVIANAGASLVKPSLETTDSEFAAILATNVIGTFAVLRAFGQLMVQRGTGKLITVSSDIGIRGSSHFLAYGASKAAIISMTKTLAWELAPAITVNSIAPGAFATDINKDLLADPAILSGLERDTPLGRVGKPEEIGPLAVFLAGPGSDFMTAQVLSLDGGIQKS